MDIKGSKTEKNLMTAFAGESQARNKYTYYASKATSRSRTSSKRPQTTRKNTQRCGSSCSTAASATPNPT